MNLKLTIVDTVGYGDQVNKTDRYCTYFIATFTFDSRIGNLRLSI